MVPDAVVIPTGGPPKVVGPKTKTIARPTNKLLRYVHETAAFAWHYDSFPFVCVTMPSDCTGMVGEETALKTATGEIMKVRGPAMVSFPHRKFSIIQGCAVKSVLG
jgi:hypothetical protein